MAQLDRASGYGLDGWGFESLLVRHIAGCLPLHGRHWTGLAKHVPELLITMEKLLVREAS